MKEKGKKLGKEKNNTNLDDEDLRKRRIKGKREVCIFPTSL